MNKNRTDRRRRREGRPVQEGHRGCHHRYSGFHHRGPAERRQGPAGGLWPFEVKKRAARTGLNPRTKETIEIPASAVPTFKAGKALKDAVAK